MRYCNSQLKNDADAQDAAQRCLIKVIEQASEYDAARSALSWVLAIAYWECRTDRTRRLRQRTDELSRADSRAVHETPEQLLEEAQLAQAADELLRTLSDEERAILAEGEDELPGQLRALAPATRRKRKQRILARLRESFALILHPEEQSYE